MKGCNAGPGPPGAACISADQSIPHRVTSVAVCCAAGLDVLEVVRGLDVFAACFAYSAATQAFVQRPAAAPPGAAFLSVSTVCILHGNLG